MRLSRQTTSRSALFGALSFCLGATALMSARPAHAWGIEGHGDIANVAVRSLPAGPLKSLFEQNLSWFEKTSAYPDRWRNRPDNAEAPRHFFDTERFGSGTNISKIPHAFGDVLKLRSYEQLREDGVNPWTVRRRYQLLVTALREKRMDDAFMQAAFLSHYVGDAHVPFHTSENYDGQLSKPSQKGVHSRFETQLLQRSIKATDLSAGAPIKITDPLNDTFTTLQGSINDIPALLAADKEAVGASGGAYNDTYWTAFIPKARPIAVRRLETGGRTLAGFLQAAYEEAGSPALPSSFTITDRYLPYAPAFAPRGEAPRAAQPAVTDEAKAAARARVENIQVESKELGRPTPVNVILPKDYATSTRRYPVMYLLHGASGKFSDWNNSSGIAAYVADLPLIVVMPDAGGNSFYINSTGKGDVADYFIRELIPAIDAKYRTDARKQGRVIAGLSMGGYGAWKLALDHPDLFQATASLSGALFFGEGDPASPPLAPYINALYGVGVNPEVYAKNRLLPLLEKQVKDGKYTGPALYFDIGADDFLIKSNQEMEKNLLTNGAIPFEYAEFRGAHTWPYWDEHVRDVLQFLMRQLTTAE
jgi:putative tributyrin esterase